MPDFSQRSAEFEIMDDLDCKGEVVHQTLRELEFINRWLGGNAVTLEGVRRLARNERALLIADLGCGGGDMLKLLAKWGRANGIALTLVGIDANPHIIEFAKNNCKEYPEISFEALDIFSVDFSARKFDIVTATLFFHHFQSDVLATFFSQLKGQAKIGLVINDLHRHWLAFHSIRLLTRFFSKSTMVKFDAPLSVLRGFSRTELTGILADAEVTQYQMKWKWAFRWQIISKTQVSAAGKA